MKYDALQNKLLAAARCHPPSAQVPYAFEQRILARLRELPKVDPLAFWSRWLWRAAMSSLMITLLAGAWAMSSPPTQTGALADDFEGIVYAGLNEITDSR